MANANERTRNWNIVVYPDSAPENWKDLLDEQRIEWVCSPLHEFDVDPNGEVKKAHYHVLLMFGGVKSYEQVISFIEFLHCPIPQRCHNARASVRYMAHLDNPNKFQYSSSEIESHGGVDLQELLKPCSSLRYSMLKDMCEYIHQHQITEFSDFVFRCMDEHYDDWFPLITDNSSYFIGQVIKSVRFKSAGVECYE